jgi:hypothetical protein
MQIWLHYRNLGEAPQTERRAKKNLGLRIRKGEKMFTKFWWESLSQHSHLDGRQ